MDRAALNQSPASPNTPVSANSYQVNVNRTKTRKWVEARVQSYDGDDWGVDDYHDDANDSADESLSHLQQSSMPAHSPETRVYSNPGSAAPVALASARSPSQQYVVGTEPVQPRLDSNSSSPFAPSFSAAANAADNQRDFSPGLGARGLAIIPNSADSEPRGSTAHVDFAASEPGVSAGNPRQEDHAAAAPAAALPPLDRSWKNFEGKSPRGRLEPFPRHRQQAFGDNADRLKDDALQGSTSPGDRRESRRASRSPQLPDMARMSSFGTDLLTAAGFSSPSSPVEASHDGHGTASPTNDDVNASNPQKQSPVPDDSFPSASKTDQLKLTPDSPPSDHDYDIGNHDDHVSKEADQHFESPKLLSNPVAHDDDAKEPLGSIDASSLSSLDSEAKEQLAAANLGHVSDSSQPNHAAVEPLRTLSPAQLAKNASEDVAAHSTADDGNDVKPAANAATDEHFESQPVQRGNTFSTIASSPVKESDVLRDEILRSLSPGGGDRMALPSQDASAVRASSYTLGAYDSYWADTTTETAKAPTELDEAHESGQEEEQEEQGQTNAQASIPDGSEPRRKFSWEADDQKDDSRPGSEIVHVRHSPAHGPPSVSETASSPIRLDTQVNLEGHQGLAESPSLVLNHALTGMEQGDTGNEPAAPAVMANQDRDTALTMAPPQPPLPASLASDGAGAAAVSGSRSLASETTPPQEADSGATAPTPPPDEGHPVAGDWPSTRGSGHQSGLPVMTFREILAVPSSSARVAKFIETRDYFANVQFGLDAWLAALDKQHLDLGVPSAVEYIGPLLSASSHQSLGATPPAIQQSQQQAYPGASNAATSPKGRSRKAGLSISSQSGGGALGHSSNQLGTKSKELMHSAGKMGKGLLSKGKNKLRSSGDKVFH
ncbi:hypothetical protein CDD82_5547 [Ophiocordyceps australis]|uniref:Uncharacterized protein n=1 Tax=Ophiocordyceps australis TaxID=1399860 RepID=A0A2C5YUU0_9HYPO|nr:hypothetical protein CDD82_5547 [Ophiocordyceps australis]